MRKSIITCDSCGIDCTEEYYIVFHNISTSVPESFELCPNCLNKQKGVCPVCGSGMSGGVLND